MGAIWARVKYCHWATASGFQGQHFGDVVLQVLSFWVIRPVHSQRLGIMVDGDVRVTSQGPSKAGTRAAASGKQINDQPVHSHSPPAYMQTWEVGGAVYASRSN